MRKFAFTHADKALWPEDGYTKGDMLAYYHSVSRFILPYIKNRPLSLHRFPNGIESGGFFQKDVTDKPSWLKTVAMKSDTEKKTVHYVVCNDVSSLAYLVQLACIEMNPWNSRVQNPNHPDYLVLDLDPEDAPFSAVIKTARAVKNVLDKARAPNICKTSGGRGLHVYVPLGAKYDFEQTRLFAVLIAQRVHEAIPKIASVERGVAGKVHVDYPQNRRGATTVAAYSLRPRPGAPVSTPLRWSEVKPGLDPLDFNIKTVGRRLKRVDDLWKPVLGPGIDMKKCLDRLNAV